jgi:hypothetical protein
MEVRAYITGVLIGFNFGLTVAYAVWRWRQT